MHFISSKVKIIFIISAIFIISMFNVYEVYGNSLNVGFINTGNLGGGSSPGGHDYRHQIIAVGYRVSLVYTKDGSRAKYNGKETKSVDYWNDSRQSKIPNMKIGYDALSMGDNNSYYNSDSRHYFSNKQYTKQELLDDDSFDWVENGNRFNDQYLNNTNNLKHSAAIGAFYTENANNCYNIGTAYGIDSDNCVENSGNNYTVHVLDGIMNFLNSDIDNDSKNWVKFNKYLTNCGYGTTTLDNKKAYNNVKKASSEGITLQIEPVEYILIYCDTYHYSCDWSGGTRLLYIGTISELYKMWADRGFFHDWWAGGYSEYTTLSSKIFALQTADDKKDEIKKKAGLYLGVFRGKTAYDLGTEKKYINTNPPNFYNTKSSLGVSLITLSDYLVTVVTCDTNAKNYISNYVNSKLSIEEARFNYFKEINEVSIDGDTGKPVYDNCIDTSNPTGYMYGSTPLYNVKKECNVLDPDNIDLFNGYANSVSGNVCVKYDCNTLANKIYSSYFNSNKSKYEGEISKLKKQYPGNNMLDTTYWQNASEFPEIFGKVNGPKCENIEIDCDVTQNVVGNCENNGISFTDSSKKFKGKECYKAGVSYNVGSVIQGSKAHELSSSTCNVYCKESVTFNLPGSPSGLKGKAVAAGTVLKWGVTSKSDSKFGEMTVTRTCQATGTSCKLGNPMNWTDKIGTKVSVYFKESNGSVINHELKTNLSEVKFNGNLPTSTSSNLSSTSCNSFNGCKNIMNKGGNFTLSAKFTFNYSNDAHNYSDKSTADGKVLTNVSSDAKYIDIGYGFPVKFTSRAYTYDIYDSKHKKYLWGALDTISGYLYASIKNIGTKVNGGYHFDKIIKETSSKDGSYVVSGNEYSVRYSCPFSTSNLLWDAECFDKDGNKYPLGSSYCKDDEKPKGLDVVFRTVQLINKNVSDSEKEAELNKAFPGRSGNGRYTSRDRNNNRVIGSNWLTIENNEADNTKRIFEILSNMVYAQEPAYHIVLDTTKINYIRRNNVTYRNADFDPYTSNQRYKFDKTGANIYAYGASDFITELINTNWLDGVCASGDTDARAKRGACRQS